MCEGVADLPALFNGGIVVSAGFSAFYWYKAARVDVPPIGDWRMSDTPPFFYELAEYNTKAAGGAALAAVLMGISTIYPYVIERVCGIGL